MCNTTGTRVERDCLSLYEQLKAEDAAEEDQDRRIV
jgi:hypothetical protein